MHEKMAVKNGKATLLLIFKKPPNPVLPLGQVKDDRGLDEGAAEADVTFYRERNRTLAGYINSVPE